VLRDELEHVGIVAANQAATRRVGEEVVPLPEEDEPRHLGARPVVAVIYSHSHIDHFGGVRGLLDEADVKAGKAQVIAPKDFMEYAVSENVYAGTAMTSRAFFQYGVLLPVGPFGHAGMGLGQNVAAGEPSLIAPTRSIEKDIEELTVDGIRMIFQNTPDAEAPSEMNTYFPDMKALWMAENVTSCVHNIYTLRGALIRDALLWSKYINQALHLFVQDTEVMFASHHWPRWGNERVRRCCETSVTPTPTSTTRCSTLPTRASPSTRSTPGGQGSPDGRLRAAGLPIGDPGPAKQLLGGGLRAALGACRRVRLRRLPGPM